MFKSPPLSSAPSKDISFHPIINIFLRAPADSCKLEQTLPPLSPYLSHCFRCLCMIRGSIPLSNSIFLNTQKGSLRVVSLLHTCQLTGPPRDRTIPMLTAPGPDFHRSRWMRGYLHGAAITPETGAVLKDDWYICNRNWPCAGGVLPDRQPSNWAHFPKGGTATLAICLRSIYGPLWYPLWRLMHKRSVEIILL